MAEGLNETGDLEEKQVPEVPQKKAVKRKRRVKRKLITKKPVVSEKIMDEKPERKKRVSLGVPRARLAVNKRDGYVRRWINDRDGRVSRAKEGGYNFVKENEVQFVDSDVCNTDSVCKVVDSDGTKAYLMEITQEYYDEDQAEKRKLVDTTEDALRRGEDAQGAPGRDGRYIPKEGIKITH